MRQRLGNPLGGEHGVTLTELAVTIALFAFIMIGVVSTWTKAQEAYFVGSETAEVQQNVRAAMDLMVREIRAAGRDLTQCAFDYTASNATFTGVSCVAARQTSCQTKLGGNYSDANNATCPGGVSNPTNGCGCVFAMPFGDLSSTTLRVRADRNDNGRIAGRGNAVTSGGGADPGAEDVKYALSTGSNCPTGVPQCITRDDGTGPQAMVAVDISGFTLTYYPRPGFPPCDAASHGGTIPVSCPSFVPADQPDADNIGRIQISVTALQGGSGYVGQGISRTMITDVYLRNRN